MATNPKIQQKADDIRNKVYGREVREALASGLEVMSEDVEETKQRQDNVELQFQSVLDETTGKDVISAPEVTAARVGADGTQYSNLKQRLDSEHDNITAQLAETKNDVDSTKAEVLKKRDKNVPITMDDLHTQVKEAMTGGAVAVVGERSVRSESIVDKEVLPRNCSFVKAGKNKFDGRYVPNRSIAGPQGQRRYSVSSDGYYCAVVPVEPNTTYTVSKEGGDRFRICANIGYPQDDELLTRELAFDDTASNLIVTTQENEDYLVIYVTTPDASLPLWMQVEEGNQATPYTRQKVVVDLENDAINMNMVKNGFIEGHLTGQSRRFNVDTKSKKIKTEFQGGFVTAGNKKYPLKDAEFSFASFEYNSIIVAFDLETSDILFFSVDSIEQQDKSRIAIIGKIRVDEDNYFFNGFYQLNNQTVRPFVGDSNGSTGQSRPTFLISETITENYEPMSTFIPFQDTTIDDLYGIYDDLVTAYPDYITKTLVGNEYTGLPIYRYDFVPPEPLSPRELVGYRFPRIFFSHVHGHEKIAAFAAANFFKDLCEKWAENSALSMLRWNVEFSVIPIVNPWGFNNNNRLNSRGVDINRNFPTGWTPDYTDIEYDYPGEGPASEIETQYLLSIMNNEEFDLAIDHHQYGGLQTSEHAFYFSSRDEKVRALLASVAQTFMPYLKKTFPGIPKDNSSIVRISGYPGVDNSLAYVEWDVRGTKAVLVEGGVSVGDGGTDEDVQKFQTYLVGNTIVKLIKNYDWLL